jgi:hypothetical protein
MKLMQRKSQELKLDYLRTMLLIGVVASLCLSVSAATRSFAVASPQTTEQDGSQPSIKSPTKLSLIKFQARSSRFSAPTQQRSKRQQVQLATPLRFSATLLLKAQFFVKSRWQTVSHSDLILSQPSGRAPPRAA